MAVAAIAAGAAHASAQPATEPAIPASPTTPEQDLEQYLSRLGANLNQGPQPQRDEAAQRLIEIGSYRTQTMIWDALRGSDERAQNASAKAIGDGRAADPRWLEPLLQMLQKDRTVDAAAHALVRYDTDPRAYQPLIDRARSRQQASRTNIIRSLGEIVQKPVADALVAIDGDATEDHAVVAAAADALQELSGQSGLGNDPRHWQAWSNSHSAARPAEWRAQVLSEQHPALERKQSAEAAELPRFKAAISAQLARQYDRLSPADKQSTLLSLLRDDDANVREIGVDFVSSAVSSGQPIREDVHKLLIDLVGDASPDVRDQAVTVLRNLGDQKALDALLVQLQIEQNSTVKLSLLKAVGGIASTKSVGIVEHMLQDPSPQIAAEAARTIGSLAGVIRSDPIRSKQVFDALQKVMEDRTGPPGTPGSEPGAADLRASLVETMARLAPDARVEARDLFPRLLNLNEPPQVREAGLMGLAALGPQSADEIARELDPNNEPDRDVRRAAATALGQVGAFDYAAQLDKASRKQFEPDPQVRDAARKAFQNLLPSASVGQLENWADLYYRDRELDRPDRTDREIAVRQELARKLQADAAAATGAQRTKDLENLAVEQQRIGERYYQSDPPRYDQAVPYLQKALGYWEGVQSSPPPTQIVQELEDSLLRSGQYREAAQFGAKEINRNAIYQDIIGPEIRNMVDALHDKGDNGDAGSYKAALDLIIESLKMPLDPQRLQHLNDVRNDIEKNRVPGQ